MGEITRAQVTSEYHCIKYKSKIPPWKPPRFKVRCSECKTSWKCDKARCTCEANITMEQSSEQVQKVTLEDSLLLSIVSVKQQGYCKMESIESKLLRIGRSVMKISQSLKGLSALGCSPTCCITYINIHNAINFYY